MSNLTWPEPPDGTTVLITDNESKETIWYRDDARAALLRTTTGAWFESGYRYEAHGLANITRGLGAKSVHIVHLEELKPHE